MSDEPAVLDEFPAPAAGRSRAAFGFIFVSAVASAMSIGIMVPILPNLLKQFSAGDTAMAAEWNVTFAVAGGLMSFFAGPVLGLLSDRFGRRPVLLISLTGFGIDFLFMAFAPSLDRKSTRLNSSHPSISYAVFCLKKKKPKKLHTINTNTTTQHTILTHPPQTTP